MRRARITCLPAKSHHERLPRVHPNDRFRGHEPHCSGRDFSAFALPDPELLAVALSPFMQCLMIHGCCCTSSSGIRFSGSSTSSCSDSVSQLSIHQQKCSYPLNQVSSLWADETGNSHFRSCNSSLRHNRCVLERCLANQKLIREHSQAPEVHFLIVVVVAASLDHLGREIVQRTAHCLATIVWCMKRSIQSR